MRDFYKGVVLLLAVLLRFQAYAPAKLVDTKTMGMSETMNFTVQTEGVRSVRWLSPHGFKIMSGQGTGTIMLQSSFLAQDGKLSAVRLFEDGHNDTLSYAIQVYRKVDKVEDHTISEGQEIFLAGAMRTKADIYYEQTGERDGRPLYTAHRLTVLPPNHVEYSQPVLQTVTANSVWVTWRTSTLQPSKVSYGTQPLDKEAEGTAEKMGGNYYWHSVELKGLQPNTTYSYKITAGGSPETYRFHTPPVIGSKQKMRILLMGDHQIKSRSGYEWLFQAAKRKVEERYGDVAENIQMIMNVGDQVDAGTLQQYEQIHVYKSKLLSPYLPTMTVVGNHETYSDPGMKNYAAHYHYENLSYRGVTSGTENYYAYQVGRVLFVCLSTEHAGNAQKSWVKKVADEAKADETVDFIISVNHRPIQAEQYIGDISAWVRNEAVPILNTTGKHVLNFGGHHHLYHRGQKPEAPLYHIINGGASWNQLWGMSSEQDFDDVQKTIDYWGYQILEFTYDDEPKMTAECYAIGNKDIVRDNLLIDTFHRQYGQPAPHKPSLAPVDETVTLPYTFKGSPYVSEGKDSLNTVEYQISTTVDFSSIVVDNIRDVENLYGSTHSPLHIPLDINENVDITQLTIPENGIKNGVNYVRVRYRDANLEWSEWSDVQKFTVKGSIDGDPVITMDVKRVDVGQEFTVSYNYAPVGKNAWIGIFHKGQVPGPTPSVTWAYTTGVSGTLKFTLSGADEYFAVLFRDGGYKEAAPRIKFFVGSELKYSIDKKVYKEGEPVRVTYTNAPALRDDWFGVYRMGETPGNGTDLSDSWSYVDRGVSDGLITLATGSGFAYSLPKGYYFISYFSRGKYFEPFERQYFSVGSEISSVASHKDNYLPGDDIKIDYADGPGTPKDWVGFYREGKQVGIDELDGFFYTYSATDGTITIPAGKLPAGDYYVSLYINDSYDAVSNTIHLSIAKAPLLTLESYNDGQIAMSFEDSKAWRDSISSILVDGREMPVGSYSIDNGHLVISAPELGSNASVVVIKAKGWQDNTLALSTTGIRSTEQPGSWQYDAATRTFSLDAVHEGTLRVISADGRLLTERRVRTGANRISLEGMARQMVIVSWVDQNGKPLNIKIRL